MTPEEPAIITEITTGGNPDTQAAFLQEDISTDYAFANGEPLLNAPPVPLQELFLPYTKAVLAKLNESGLVICMGQSRTGKTEIFLGQNLRGIRAGGVMDVVNNPGVIFYADLNSMRASALRDSAKAEMITATPLSGRMKKMKDASLFLLDEAVFLVDHPDMAQAVAEINQSRAKNIILVGGGYSSSQEQEEAISAALQAAGADIKPEQLMRVPAYILTEDQAVEYVMHGHNPQYKDIAVKIVRRLDQLGLPRVFQAIASLDATFISAVNSSDPDGIINALEAAYFKTILGNFKKIQPATE